MKAIVYHSYGSPDVLHYEETEKPVAGDNEVLLRVRAASVNPYDWHFMRGTPRFIRIMTGLRRPKENRLGVDVAGKVEAVGKNITQFKPGDEVFGACLGAFAEYACVPESSLVIKPDNVTFAQAASVPIAGLTALQGLRDKGQIQPGQKVLINGAAGGVGTFAVQIAKSLGAHVTGVCSSRNVEMVRRIGADRVIDYTQEDFAKAGPTYDLLFDCIGNHSLLACTRVLHPKGIYVGVGAARVHSVGLVVQMVQSLVLSWFVSQKLVGFIAKINKEDLVALRDLIQAEKVTPVIDRSYSLSHLLEAIRYLEEGHARGKVAIVME
jgi:NADPH:quinone reductase-like Zn-dependent oxidoreductase